MPRALRVRQSQFPYHITNRSVNKMPFPIKPDKLWKLFSKRLHFCSFAFNIEIHAFVLMSNHYHLIVRCPDNNLSEFMTYFNREMSKEINILTNKINQNFGTRYYSTIVDDPRYYLTVYRYVYRNPVDAGLAKKVEDYPFSSFQFVLGKRKFEFPVFDYPVIESGHYLDLSWLNKDYQKNEKQKIRTALKKQYYKN
jgi:putative transposase